MINFDYEAMETFEGIMNGEKNMKDVIRLLDGEILCYDIDDAIESELTTFHFNINKIEVDRINEFKNWVYVYKALNYDIFEDLKITNVYKFSEKTAVVELNYYKNKEYDILILTNDEDKTVNVMTVVETNKNDKLKDRVIRRKLIPTTAEEALAYAKRDVSKKELSLASKLINTIKTKREEYEVDNDVRKLLGMELIKEKPKASTTTKVNNTVKEETNKTNDGSFSYKVDSKYKTEVIGKRENVVNYKVDSKYKTDYVGKRESKEELQKQALRLLKQGNEAEALRILRTKVFNDKPMIEREKIIDKLIKSITNVAI